MGVRQLTAAAFLSRGLRISTRRWRLSKLIILREANKVADYLTNYGLSLATNYVLFNMKPDFILNSQSGEVVCNSNIHVEVI
jgi:hypothetical protein